jgi:hypothetical protein
MPLTVSAKMKVQRLTDKDHQLVTEFLRGTFSSPTHWPGWNSLVSRYYSTDFYYYGLVEGGALQGIFPVHEVRQGLIACLQSGQFHYIPYGGWIKATDARGTAPDIPVRAASRLECFALPAVGEFGYLYPKATESFSTMIVDLARDESAIWSGSVDSKRRNMVRKALKSGVTVASGEAVMADFYRLYEEGARLNGLTPMSRDFLTELEASGGDVQFIPYVAFKSDRPVGALGLIHDKDYAIYWLGATDRQSPGLGQGEILQWEAIRYSRRGGCRYYDLCFVDRERLPGIYEFKKGFSDRTVTVPYLNRRRFSYKVLNKIKGR